MRIQGLQRLTLLDYPGHTAATVFLGGCNMRCPFCHNSSLIPVEDGAGAIELGEFFEFLDKRQRILDGICISGGEPLMDDEVYDFVQAIKKRGFLVKIDTNGTNPGMIKRLTRDGLVDYIAMDIKNSWQKYPKTCGVTVDLVTLVKKSMEIIDGWGGEHEFRTTIVDELHQVHDIEEICGVIGANSKYFIQNFRKSEEVLSSGLSPVPQEKLGEMLEIGRAMGTSIFLRG